MSTVLQVAAAASRQIANAQAAVTHNLANAGTTAFKADLFYAEQGYARNGEAGSSAVDYRAGNISFTGRDLDIAIAGDGWMRVITPGGEEVLSRRGDLRVDPTGNLVDAEQNQILGDGGPINVPADSRNTEPLLRLNLVAPDADACSRRVAEVQAIMEQAGRDLGPD